MNIHKTCGIWFSGKNLGLANGVVSAGMALGFMIGSLISATVISPWLGGWQYVLFLYGGIAMAMSLPWALVKAAPDDAQQSGRTFSTTSMRHAFWQVVRLKNVWLLGLAIMGIGGGIQGALGYLPLYLRGIGWPAAQADTALATFHAVSMLGVMPIAIFSDRIGSRKMILISATIAIAVGIGLLTVVQGMVVWMAVIIAGLFRDGFMAIFMTSVIEIKGVGAMYAGTATGFTLIFLQIGHLIAPPAGNSLAAFNPGTPFAFWALLAILGLVCLYFYKETGSQVTYSSPLPEAV
jgi:cyanate permease